jgi:hypothetical protein
MTVREQETLLRALDLWQTAVGQMLARITTAALLEEASRRDRPSASRSAVAASATARAALGSLRAWLRVQVVLREQGRKLLEFFFPCFAVALGRGIWFHRLRRQPRVDLGQPLLR